MFLSEFNCCHKMLRHLKWWNSLCCALFSACLMSLFIVCVQQQISLPTVRNLLWSEALCRNPSPKVENEVNAQKQISIKKKPTKLNNNAFLQLVHHVNQTVVVWPAHLRPPAVCSQQKKRQNDFGFRIVQLIFYLKLALLRERSIMYDMESQRKDFWQLSRPICSSPKDSHPVGLRSSRADAGLQLRPFLVRWPGWNRWSAA